VSEPFDWVTSPTPALPGTISTILKGRRAVIWLQGDIDLAMAGELGRVQALLPRHITHLLLDLSRMAFCDGTLIAFIEAMLEHHTVSVRQPSPLAADFLRTVGLSDDLRLADETTGRSPAPSASASNESVPPPATPAGRMTSPGGRSRVPGRDLLMPGRTQAPPRRSNSHRRVKTR
jgi:hypothetical protein